MQHTYTLHVYINPLHACIQYTYVRNTHIYAIQVYIHYNTQMYRIGFLRARLVYTTIHEYVQYGPTENVFYMAGYPAHTHIHTHTHTHAHSHSPTEHKYICIQCTYIHVFCVYTQNTCMYIGGKRGLSAQISRTCTYTMHVYI